MFVLAIERSILCHYHVCTYLNNFGDDTRINIGSNTVRRNNVISDRMHVKNCIRNLYNLHMHSVKYPLYPGADQKSWRCIGRANMSVTWYIVKMAIKLSLFWTMYYCQDGYKTVAVLNHVLHPLTVTSTIANLPSTSALLLLWRRVFVYVSCARKHSIDPGIARAYIIDYYEQSFPVHQLQCVNVLGNWYNTVAH